MLCLLIETTSPKGSLGLYSLSSLEENTFRRPPEETTQKYRDFSELEPKRNIQELRVKTWTKGSHSALITSAFKSLLPFFPKAALDSSLFFSSTSENPLNMILVLGVGPGRFTGVRVGVSFAKSLSFVLGVPIYPVSSLKIMAESQITQEKPVLVLQNAFKSSLYTALYQKEGSQLKERIPPCVVLPKDLNEKIKEQCVCVGDGYRAYESFFPAELKARLEVKEDIFPEVKYLSTLLRREFDPNRLIHWKKLRPVYLRSPVQLII